jgi:hypothetical protein
VLDPQGNLGQDGIYTCNFDDSYFKKLILNGGMFFWKFVKTLDKLKF